MAPSAVAAAFAALVATAAATRSISPDFARGFDDLRRGFQAVIERPSRTFDPSMYCGLTKESFGSGVHEHWLDARCEEWQSSMKKRVQEVCSFQEADELTCVYGGAACKPGDYCDRLNPSCGYILRNSAMEVESYQCVWGGGPDPEAVKCNLKATSALYWSVVGAIALTMFSVCTCCYCCCRRPKPRRPP
mmetsp:Transcript_87223/g.251559  ORF Transcript_87223/g.251559 Transcript_87223/m.251559 type:complete len:190 (-) Transcript_87223:257-826(-)